MLYNLTMEFSFIDLCAGIGAGRVALESLGLKCKNYSEIDNKAIQTYKLFFDENYDGLGDLMKITAEDVLNTNLLIAGFPCQSYSIVGKRKGLDDERGQIIFGIVKILKEANIPYFILENVKGILNSNAGADFDFIINLLESAGYNVSYKLLNSLHYGVPQSRERVYFVGIRNNLDETVFNFPIGKKYNYDLSNIFRYTNLIDKNTPQYKTFLRYLNNKYNEGKYNLEELLDEDNLVLDTRQSDLRLYRGLVPTIRKGRQGILYTYGKNLYSLSNEEALLFQGFSNEIINKASNINTSVMLAQVGNSMTVNVIESIASNLLKIMTKNLEYEKTC